MSARARVTRLKRVLDVQETRVLQAARLLRDAMQRARAARARLTTLADYRQPPAPGAVHSACDLDNRHRFMQRLAAALREQDAAVAAADADVRAAREHWQAARHRQSLLETVVRRRSEVVAAEERRAEQQEFDELAARTRLAPDKPV